jgi:hypothetical protein
MSTLSFRRQPTTRHVQDCYLRANEQDRTEQNGMRYDIVYENLIETLLMNGKWELGDIIPSSHE